MLSESKTAIRAAEVVAILGTALCIAVAIKLYAAPNSDFPIELAFIAGFALLMLSFLPACLLCSEYMQTVRTLGTRSKNLDGLSATELNEAIQWAPVWQKIAALLAILVAVGTAISFGPISGHDGNPPSKTSGVAAALYLSAFFLLPLPLLGSAARMPGSYAESCRGEA